MNDTQVLTLTDFLLARIAEDEAEAQRDLSKDHSDPAWSFAWQTPDRLLAECEAKRRIVAAYLDLCETCDHGPWVLLSGCCQCGVLAHALLTFATAHEGHPDYREEWRP